jgi:hypothetical protein
VFAGQKQLSLAEHSQPLNRPPASPQETSAPPQSPVEICASTETHRRPIAGWGSVMPDLDSELLLALLSSATVELSLIPE